MGMKYRDKDGNVFEDIEKAVTDYHNQRGCLNCPFLEVVKTSEHCVDWAKNNLAEAARLMGYEVVEDVAVKVNDLYDEDGGEVLPAKEANMDKQKPHFTKEEVETAKAIKVVYPKAKKIEYVPCVIRVYSDEGVLAHLSTDLFPSILPGQSVRLSEIVGADQHPA